MRFEWLLALKYFRGKRKESRFLSFIKVMDITGVTIGAGGLLIALSIVHGFKSVIYEKVLGYGAHIEVATFGPDPLYRADTLVSYLQKYPEIAEVQEVVEGQGMIQFSDQVEGTFFKGVSPEGDVSALSDYIDRGSYNLASDAGGLPGIVLGEELARNLGTDVGKRVTTYAIEGMPSPLNPPEIQQFRVNGIYKTGIEEFDDVMVLIGRKYARELFKMPGVHASRVEMKLNDLDNIAAFDAKLGARLSFPYYTETIYERHSSIFAWVNLQEETIPFVISVMIIVAAFNLIGTVLMMVLERTGDIGILKTMGARARQIRFVFVLEGLFVAFVGLIAGIALSLLFYWLQSEYHIIPLSEENYYMAYAPVEPHALDFLLVTAVTLLLCTLASWLPARIAAKMDPVKIISYGRH